MGIAANRRKTLNLGGMMFAVEMGGGKTKMTIDGINNMPADHIRNGILIACPKAVIPTWPREFNRHGWVGRKYEVAALQKGTVTERHARAQEIVNRCTKDPEKWGYPVIVINHESLWREPFAKWALDRIWGAVVVDESHKAKDPNGRLSNFLGRLSLRAMRRIALTGTPMPHSPLDVFGQYRFLDPAIFGTSWWKFRNRYAQMGGFGGKQVVGFQNLDELNRKFYSIAFRATKDVLDLPPEMDEEIRVEMGSSQGKVYRDLYNETCAEVDAGEITATNALVKLLRLQQIAGGSVTTDEGVHVDVCGKHGNPKAQALAGILDSTREPTVVFARFKADLDVVRDTCEKNGREYLELSGRRNNLEEWMDTGDVIGVQIQAGGAGIDLTRARYCIYYSLGFNMGDYLQSRARVHRPGQERPVTYYHLIADATVDEAVYSALKSRADIVKSVLDGIKNRR